MKHLVIMFILCLLIVFCSCEVTIPVNGIQVPGMQPGGGSDEDITSQSTEDMINAGNSFFRDFEETLLEFAPSLFEPVIEFRDSLLPDIQSEQSD